MLNCDRALAVLEQTARPTSATQITIVATRNGTRDVPLPRSAVLTETPPN